MRLFRRILIGAGAIVAVLISAEILFLMAFPEGAALLPGTRVELAETGAASFVFDLSDSRKKNVVNALQGFAKNNGMKIRVEYLGMPDHKAIDARIYSQAAGEFFVQNLYREDEYVCSFYLHGAPLDGADTRLRVFKTVFLGLGASLRKEDINPIIIGSDRQN